MLEEEVGGQWTISLFRLTKNYNFLFIITSLVKNPPSKTDTGIIVTVKPVFFVSHSHLDKNAI